MRNFKDDVRSEVAAVRDAGDKERNTQELSLVRRLNDSKKDNITELVSVGADFMGPKELKPLYLPYFGSGAHPTAIPSPNNINEINA